MSALDKPQADIDWWERQERRAHLTIAIAQYVLPYLRSALTQQKGDRSAMSQPRKPSDSATDTMRRYETNTDLGDNATPSADHEPEPVPATEPLPDTNKNDDGPIPMSDRQSPWQSENEGAETKEDTEATDGTEAKEVDPEVRTV